MSADHVTFATGANVATPTADEARDELLAFARRLHRAHGLRTLDGTQHAEVTPCGDGWRATAHLIRDLYVAEFTAALRERNVVILP